MTAASAPYAGDIAPKAAWELLAATPAAQLVDVRTMAEWSFVGVPDLSELGRQAHCIEWQSFPDGTINPAFASETAATLTAAGADKATPVLMLCRSGARSRAAATALTALGFTQAYNIASGFEGDPDSGHHRGRRNGWKADGLPWKQG
jgi:rhodanese-related sulfurtransferase